MEGRDYEVFLSFRGRDVRRGFVSHLYARLRDAGVRTFEAGEYLPIGEEIGPRLLGAIEQSKISIPIFSEGYASSKWCLDELARMVDCRSRKGQIIMPIFYDVQPFEVRRQTGGYGEAFLGHEERVDDMTICKWRAALIEVGGLRGWNVANSLGGEASIIDGVVANVLKVLNRYFVGIEHHVEGVVELLNVESSDVRVVGVHGIGGTGKTTIAKSIYKRISHLFDGCSFLESVRENVKKPGGLVNLQGQLISDLLGEMHRPTRIVVDGAKSLRSRFLHKKVLIVLDDIEPSFDLTPVLGILDWLGSGSRIIITARDEQALDELKVFLKYKVMGMQQGDALKLFLAHAFEGRSAPDDFATLSEDIVSTMDRLPLTIEVVGSYLFSKSKDAWERTLDELKKVPEQVQQKMMVIIEELPDKQRQIFLDIACFFVGEDESVTCYLWSDLDSASRVELEGLVLSSIVKIENKKLWMHDELRELGRNMVKCEHHEPGKRSRLWIHEEASDVLMEKKGTESVEGVLLKFDSRSQCSFSPAHFASTSNMRFLQLDQANLEGNFERRLSSLRWLHWQGCPRNLGAENLDLKKLVILDLSWSKVNEKWKGWSEIKKAENLKVLNLTGCVDLVRTPDLSSYKRLERLILENCIWLVEIDSSVRSLQRLVSLNLRFCTELNKLPEELGVMESLEEILLDGTAVQEIPSSIGHMKNLRRFSACNCLSLIQLPDSMSQVKSLSVLALNGTKLTKLPTSIGELERLQHLSISHCRSILKLPTSLGTLASLIELDLSSTAIVELPDDVEKLNLLKVLKIDFTFVRKLPDAIWTLKRLEELHASRCRSLDGEIPRDIEKLSELRVLKLGYSRIHGLSDKISRLSKLQTLDLLHCDKLRKVPKLPSTLISLSVSSKLMDTIPDISNLVKLGELFVADGSQEQVLPVERQIEAIGCTNLQLGSLLELTILQLSVLKIQPAGLHHLMKLRKLSLCCIHLEELPHLPPVLVTLSLRHYKSQKNFPDLSHLQLLSEFELFDCALTEVPGLGKFKSLRVFRISHCNLQQLDELENLVLLESLNVSYCQSLRELPDLSKQKWNHIKIKGCPNIPDIKSVEHLNSFEKPSSSMIEAESSAKVEFSKPANTEPSSIQGVKRKYKAVSPTDKTTSGKDDCITFHVDDEDTDEGNVLERKKNKSAKSIALAIFDKPSLPPKARAKSPKSDKPITETMGTSNLSSSPSVGVSSTTRGRVTTVASKFSSQSIFGNKRTRSFSNKSNISCVEPDKDSSLSVDLIGPETTGISPSTDGTRSETMDASLIPSTDNQTEGITDGIHQRLSVQTTPALLLLPGPRQGTEGDSLSIPPPPVSEAVDSRSSLARQYENINSPAIVDGHEPSSMPVPAVNPSPSSPGHSLPQPVGRTDVAESSSSSAKAKVALEQVARILHSRVTNSSNVTSEALLASVITDEVIKAKWTEFLELSHGGFPSIANDPVITKRLKALANELCGSDIRFTKSLRFKKQCQDFLAEFLHGIDTYQQNCERIAVLVVSEKDCRYPHSSIEEVCRSLKIKQDALQTLVNDRAGLDAEEADLERRLGEVRNQQRLKDIQMAQIEGALWQDIGSFNTLMGEKNRLDEEMAEKRRIKNKLLLENSRFDHIMSTFQREVRDFVNNM
ncbi:disease resistance protein RUN1-like [Rhodamnia argentea]|uniref:Disease resistance protein RUN1-like n=1 Tax=Rhodamnia argentea TaxID=178133 RepID=A0A8B8Q2I2_9MYRT|nr:disease resistance protein RUN1-like [Rhodamnia argentea]